MGETFTHRVAETIRAEMRRRDLSQEALSALCGMSQSALSRRLTGDVPFDTAELAKVARALDVTVMDLLARDVVTT